MISINNKASTGMSVNATAKPKINRAAKSGLGLKGHAKVTIHRLDGAVEELGIFPNVIPRAGFVWVANSLYDESEPAGTARFLGLSKSNVGNKDPDDAFTVTDLSGPTNTGSAQTNNGLNRKASDDVMYVPADQNVLLGATFTNGISSTDPVTAIRTLTIYSALTGGSLIHAVDTPGFTLNGGDSVEVDWTVTLTEPAPPP